jgi:hypothetical protein
VQQRPPPHHPISYPLQSFPIYSSSCWMDTSLEVLHTLRCHRPALFEGAHLPAWPAGSGVALKELLQLRKQLSTAPAEVNCLSIKEAARKLELLRDRHRPTFAPSRSALKGPGSIYLCMQRDGEGGVLQGLLRGGPMEAAFRSSKVDDGSACVACGHDRGEVTPQTMWQLPALGITTPLGALLYQRNKHAVWGRQGHEAAPCRPGAAVYVTCSNWVQPVDDLTGCNKAPTWTLGDVGGYSPIAWVWGNGWHYWAYVCRPTGHGWQWFHYDDLQRNGNLQPLPFTMPRQDVAGQESRIVGCLYMRTAEGAVGRAGAAAAAAAAALPQGGKAGEAALPTTVLGKRRTTAPQQGGVATPSKRGRM